MDFKQITRFSDCGDFWGNSVEKNGFDKMLSFCQILEIALRHKCTVITKNGGGKWYIKGENKPFDDSVKKAIQHEGKHPGQITWVIKY